MLWQVNELDIYRWLILQVVATLVLLGMRSICVVCAHGVIAILINGWCECQLRNKSFECGLIGSFGFFSSLLFLMLCLKFLYIFKSRIKK